MSVNLTDWTPHIYGNIDGLGNTVDLPVWWPPSQFSRVDRRQRMLTSSPQSWMIWVNACGCRHLLRNALNFSLMAAILYLWYRQTPAGVSTQSIEFGGSDHGRLTATPWLRPNYCTTFYRHRCFVVTWLFKFCGRRIDKALGHFSL